MKEIIVLTHGDFGCELIKSAEMIGGKMENVSCFGLQPGVDPQSFMQSVETALNLTDKEYFILVDLFGGTPFHAAMFLTQKINAQVVTGVNLPLLMELQSQIQFNDEIDLKSVIDSAQQSMQHAEFK